MRHSALTEMCRDEILADLDPYFGVRMPALKVP